MVVRLFDSHLSTSRVVAAALAAALLMAGGCASGPSDFVKMVTFDQNKAKGPAIRDEQQQKALTVALETEGQGQAAEANAPIASPLALTVIRQQQTEEARALLIESAQPASGAPTCLDSDGLATDCLLPATP